MLYFLELDNLQNCMIFVDIYFEYKLVRTLLFKQFMSIDFKKRACIIFYFLTAFTAGSVTGPFDLKV